LSSTDAENTVAENPEEGQPVAVAEEEAPSDGMNEACRREITVEIPADIVSKQFDTTASEYSKVARVPGFRKGKVPASLIRSRFASEIRTEVLETLVPEYFRESVSKQGMLPVSQPRVLDLKMEEGQALKFTAAFEVLPEFELADYKEFKVEKPAVTVTDEEIDAELKKLQEQRASYDPVDEDRALKDGDFAQISLKATPIDAPAGDGPEAGNQPVEMDEVLVEIGGENTIPEFTEQLRGAKPGEDKVFEVTYPESHQDQRLAGKKFTYSTKINAIKKKTTPELNDAFAKELSQEFETIDDLRKRMREGMEHERTHMAEHEGKKALVALLAEKHSFEVPEALVQRQLDIRLEQFLRALAAQGMRTEDMKRMDFRRLRSSQRKVAADEVKSNLVLERIAEEEKIEVSTEDLSYQIQMMAQQSQQTPEAVHAQLMKDRGMEYLANRIRTDKALALLYARATGAENGTNEGERTK
jgi:trigger factor